MGESGEFESSVFLGGLGDALELSLVLEARGIMHRRRAVGETLWSLDVSTATLANAAEELERYRAERQVFKAPRLASPATFSGSGWGAAVYGVVLMAVAYAAGIDAFGRDWRSVGAIDSTLDHGGSWWRAVTALTLHVDQQHLLGNLLFGVGIGVLAGRMFGPGIAWLGILLAGAAANGVEMIIAPPFYRAIGASTAVFAALGLVAGYAWRDARLRHVRALRWGPLFGAVSLLALLGAGDAHVDVLGHLLGFGMGLAEGSLFAVAQIARHRRPTLQFGAGIGALLLIALAWTQTLLRP